MAKKKPKKKVAPKADHVLDEKDGQLVFDIRDKGEVVATIIAYDYELHRAMIQAQSDAIDAGRKERSAYIPFYADALSELADYKISHRTAYQIATIVCESIADLKKDIDG